MNKAYRDKHYADLKRKERLRKYGITDADYNAILESQGGRCAICRTDKSNGNGRFCVDHDHGSGAVRGLLCNMCNWGLGHFKDSPENLSAAISYLERGSVQSGRS